MRNARPTYLLLLWLLALTLPIKAFANNDSGAHRHRISVLPSQILLSEYSLFYEFQLTPLMAAEISAGYQGDGPSWASEPINILDPDIDVSSMKFKGITARANFKVFLPEISPNLYVAPMFLYKLHRAESSFSYIDSWTEKRQDISTEARRTSVGTYGLVGIRTHRALYVDAYAGIGLRYFQDYRTRDHYVDWAFKETTVSDNPSVFPDFKLGLKIGLVLF